MFTPEQDRAYRKKNAEKIRAQRRISRARQKENDPEAFLKYHREATAKYRRTHIDKVKAGNKISKQRAFARDPEAERVKRRARNRIWKKNNKDKVNAAARRRRLRNPENHRIAKAKHYAKDIERSRMLGRLSSHLRRSNYKASVEDQQRCSDYVTSEQAKRFHICYYCKTKFSGTFHVDHIIAIAIGGAHTCSNLCISCPSCNCRKWTKRIGEWQPLTNQPLLSL